MPPGSVLLERFELGRDALRELHGVGVAFLVDGELDALSAIEARDGGAVLVAAFDARDVLEVHRLAIDVGDDGVRHVVERVELVDGAHQETLRALFQAAAGEVHVFGADALRHLFDRQPQLRQALLVDVDLHLVFEAAADLDRRRAFHRFDLRLDAIVGETAQELEAVLVAAGPAFEDASRRRRPRASPARSTDRNAAAAGAWLRSAATAGRGARAPRCPRSPCRCPR